MRRGEPRRPPALVLSLLAPLLALGLLAAAPTATGQDASAEGVVYVRFQRGDLHPISAPDEKAVARRIAEVLEGRAFQAWRFVASSESEYPRLVARVEAGDDYLLVLHFEPAPGQRSAPWSARLFGDGELADLGGLPTASELPDAIRNRFDDELVSQGWLEKNEGDLFDVLREGAPVARTVVLHPGQPTALLALSGGRRRALTDAEFRIECRQGAGSGQRVRLRSQSAGVCRPLPDASLEDAILVTHLDWRDVGEPVPVEQRLDQLGGLRPQRVLLEHLGTATDGCGPTTLLTVDEGEL